MTLPRLSDRFAGTREALHQLAYFVLAPARHSETGRMGLRAAPGGFATPEFDGKVARVDLGTLVVEEADRVASRSISTLGDAAEFVGIHYREDWYQGFRHPLQPLGPDETLAVDDDSARILAAWFALGTQVLDRLGEMASGEEEPSEIQLWPENFDVSLELGKEADGARATYGASPGDDHHEQPYFYVAPWEPVDRSERFWNDLAFNGASLGYGAIAESPDPAGDALAFLLRGRQLLRGN